MVKNVSVFSEEKKINKKLIHDLVSELKSELNFQIESLQINFVSLESIKKINVDFLSHNYETDIITFNYGGSKEVLESEIFISPDVAKENSNYYKCTLDEELLRLVIHGILHLIGFDDMNNEDRIIMKQKEDQLVEKYNTLLNNNSILL